SSRRRHTRFSRDWSSDVCSSDLADIMFVDASAQAQQEHGSIGDEREIWRPLILIMFLVIGVEFMLATLGGQRLDGEPEVTVAERSEERRVGKEGRCGRGACCKEM